MNTKQVLDSFCRKKEFEQLMDALQSYPNIQCNNLYGSSSAFLVAGLFEQYDKNFLVLLPDAESAGYFKSDIESILGEQKVLLLPDSNAKPFSILQPSSFNIQQRIEVLNSILKRKNNFILITYPEAFAEKVVSNEELIKNRIEISKNEKLDLDFLIEFLNECGFTREDFVYEPGHFSIRGGIIDVFSYASELPYRIELDGSNIETIRAFDPVSQLSVNELFYASLVPNLQDSETKHTASIWDYISDDSVVYSQDLPLFLDIIHHGIDKAENLYEKADTSSELLKPSNLYENEKLIKENLKKFRVLENGVTTCFKPQEVFDFGISAQPGFDKNFDMLIRHLRQNEQSGIINYVFSESGKQIERLQSIFEDLQSEVQLSPIYQGLSSGFLDLSGKTACYTEHQIFNKYYRTKSKNRYSRNQALTLKELRNLVPGDFIVHIDHGIGKFEGLQKIEMAGTLQEAVRISYKNNDLLYVNIHSLHKISKYSGKEGTEPVLNKLGSDAWQNLKRKTKTRVKDIARDLIKLYAKRKASKGFIFSGDNYLMTELEASFMYEDTPDQAKAIEDVKLDMQASNPMDRLVCGDVGFGKTEVAIRAAFKAVCDSKQVVVLVPTTILAQQHYRTFKERLHDFPVKVDYISRFRTTKQQKETLENLENGTVDIVIGTHKLLNKNIKYKDLGLLIIDEEQKFGVAAKDRIKAIKTNVDTLTLTATPIPRTLHFSIMGARDLSIINTAPPNRQPVNTELHIFNREILKSAVDAELKRGGQVFFVHNRVKDIYEMADLIEQLCPEARVCVGHGQMSGDALENVMLQFIEGEYDVLVATTIIESGLDISNANTMIINNAHYFGLSDLHQMRGRVGRSNKKAYCYLFAPTLHALTDEARRRLKAIEEFSELGSGFNVAMRDLDIRGAGNLLGGEQSGFITDIGFEMYHKILDEAIQELREEEFNEEFKGIPKNKEFECQIETDLELMIPDFYIRNISERLSLYNELSRIKEPDTLLEFEIRLTDRFGKLPKQANELIKSVQLKWLGKELGMTKISIRQNKLTAWFVNEDRFFQSEVFGSVLEFIRSNAKIALLKQVKEILTLRLEGIENVSDAMKILEAMKNRASIEV
ncbi:MAG: transcription-repair coupling factor [Flavobacteriales bacterium]|nr:transcription-repair coupling factor [Flavobacteriales bacterium]